MCPCPYGVRVGVDVLWEKTILKIANKGPLTQRLVINKVNKYFELVSGSLDPLSRDIFEFVIDC